jgi:hypothetical protein
VYAEALATGATVMVFGDAANGVGELLLTLGARSVTVRDPDAARARRLASGSPGVSIEPYASERSGLGGVDLAIVPDLGLFAQSTEVVAALKGLVGDDGVVLLGAQNRETADDPAHAFEYYELFDRVAGAFRYVTMLAELSFEGVALVALGEEDEAAVSVDTQLAGPSRVPQRFLVVASQREVALDPYMVVELPAPPEHEEPEAPPAPDRSAELQAAVEVATRRSEEAQRQAAASEQRASAAEQRAIASERVAAESAEGAAGEVRRFEDMLRERAKAGRALEVELERRDRMVRELVASLENGAETQPVATPAPAAAPVADVEVENARLRETLDTMAAEAARREGDIRALRWTIAELERRLPPPAPQVSEPVQDSR